MLKNAKFDQQIQNYFFWKSEANLETFEKRSMYIVFSYETVLKSVESLIGIFRAMENKPWLYNAKFPERIQNHFSGKLRQTLKLSKNFLTILEFPINLF